MKPIQKLIHTLLTGDSTLEIDLPTEPGETCLQASFLTVALDIIAQTDCALAVTVNGKLVHCGLFAPHTGLVLDITGIRPKAAFNATWMARTDGKATIRDMTIEDLTMLCPPESGFFARALSSFEKVIIKHFQTCSSPAIVGFQVVNRHAEHWGDRLKFEVLTQDLARLELIAARLARPEAHWSMIAVLEGDIRDPSSVNS